MNRHEYLTYRRLVRDNGTYALRWVPRESAEELRCLLREQAKEDPLAVHAGVLAYQRRHGQPGIMPPRYVACRRGACPAEPMPRQRRGKETTMTLPTLYEIRSDYLEALEVLSDPELDMPPEAIADTLEGLEGQLQEKAVNVAAFLRHLEATAEAIKEAEARMAQRRRAIENRAAGLRDYLKLNMEATGITRIESPWFELAIRKNPPAVEIDDEARLPDEFKREVTTIKVDRAALKAALKERVIPGARLTAGTRLAIR